MKHLEFEDFNQAYYQVNRKVLLEPEEYITTRVNAMGLTKTLLLSCKSTKCDEIDLGALGYKYNKWSHLVRTYLGPEKIEELQNLEGTGLSLGFDFLRRSSRNGACMLGLVLSRERRHRPWTKATIMWRTTELQRRWAADLILIHRMLEIIPNMNIQQIDLFLSTAYQSSMYVIPTLKPIFDVEDEELDPDHTYTKTVLGRKAKYYDSKKPPHKMLQGAYKLIDLYKDYQKGIEPEFIGVEDCLLIEEEE